jgi:hypothetical protein
MRLWPMVLLTLSTAAFAQSPSLHKVADTGCAGAVARYRAVQENDLSMGHVAKSVYAQIKREIDEAEKVCAAGQDAKALSMIRASEARHGYPTSI